LALSKFHVKIVKIWSLCSQFGGIQGFSRRKKRVSKKVFNSKCGLDCHKKCPNNFKSLQVGKAIALPPPTAKWSGEFARLVKMQNKKIFSCITGKLEKWCTKNDNYRDSAIDQLRSAD